MEPPGIKTLVYETPQQRKTWAQHGVDAWYIGYLPDHYRRLVVDIWPLKDEKYRVRITVGGDKLDFCGDASSVAASLATVKLLLNSVVSTKDAKFTTADIKDLFYASFLPDP